MNSNIVDENEKFSIVSTLDGIQYSEDMTVSWKDVSLLTSQLECGESARPDGVCAETIKFAHNRIAILLSLLFTLYLSHGYLPPAMIETKRLLNICKDYAEQYSLPYNGSKSFSMCFKSKAIKFKRPDLFLGDVKIPLVSECKYLGITISEKNCDQDIHRQMRKCYSNANI